MANPGQPTLYKREYYELAHNYCLLGATNELLGDFFGVARRTIQNWIATRPDFAAAVYWGRAVADARVSAMPATKRERTLWERQQKTSGGKGGKGGNLQSFGNNGLFDDGATRRKPAETGGNPVQKLCSGNCPHFPVSPTGCSPKARYRHRLRKLRKFPVPAGNDTAATRLL
jgi:hypothetical protein